MWSGWPRGTTCWTLSGPLAAGFLLDSLVGFHSAYPGLPFSSLLNAAGQQAVHTLEQERVAGELLTFAFHTLAQYTTGHLTVQQALAIGNGRQVLDENSPGLPGADIPVPVYNDRGIVDEIVPTSVEDATYHNLCATGTVVQAAVHPGEHLLTDDEAQQNVLQFIAQRLAGAPPVDSCLTNPNTLEVAAGSPTLLSGHTHHPFAYT
jgi:hypothetical protein